MLYIRADGNAEIGTGHIMRCLSIAQAVKKAGCSCTFITADREMIFLFEKQGFPYICLHSVWNDLDRETAQMEELIHERSIQTLLIDSYFVTPDYLSRLHRRTNVAYMDDLNQFVYPCSTLVNYNIYANQWNYLARYPNARLLLGTQYAPLRAEFQNLPRRCPCEKVRNVLVTTGGGDALNVAGRFTEQAVRIPKLSHVTFHVVAGRFNPYQSELERLADICSRVKLHYNVQCMSELMLNCDVAVSAAGTTLYELCACGVPTVTYALADNQLPSAAVFEQRGIMLYAGDVRENADFAEALCDRLVTLVGDYLLRRRVSKQMRRMVDGNGAGRLADRLITNLKLETRDIL